MPPTDRDETIRLLESSALLDQLSREEILTLIPHVKRREYAAGDTIFAMNTPGTSFYWLASGRIRLITSNRNGDELLHGMQEAGDHFGQVSPIDGGLRGVTAIAEDKSTVLTLEREYLLPAVMRSPEAALRFAELLCKQIRLAGDSLESLALDSAEQRIWSRLMRLSQRYGSVDPEDGSTRIAHDLSQEDLALTVGLTRVKVNRQLSTWRDDGLIEFGRGYILIPDLEAFETHVWD
jgi:CRP/FNR family cyclic AMP-dependent transcriptional regulator